MTNSKKKRLGDLLVEEGLITPEQLERAVEQQRVSGGRLGDILAELKFCAEERILDLLAKRAGMTALHSLGGEGCPSSEVLSLIPAEIARRQGIFPVERKGDVLTVALADPFLDVSAVDDLRMQTGCDIQLVLSSEKEIRKAIERCYTSETETPLNVVEGEDSAVSRRMEIIITALLETALKVGADHVLIEPGPTMTRVRYRVKGVFETRPDLPAKHHRPLVAHLKRLAGLNPDECWLPQDGRIQRRGAHRILEVKIATLPTATGEKVALLLMSSGQIKPLDLVGLGLDAESLATVRDMIGRKRGLVLVTGPAGSGKSSTLYAALSELNTPDRHVASVEDPVERIVDGVTQIRTRADARLTTASAIHLLRRQALDVLMVDDLSNADAAEAALDAASNGIVLAGFSAGDATGAVQRLVEWGVRRGVLADRLNGVVAQRRVRTLCLNCREAYTLTLRELMAAGVGEKEVRIAKRGYSFTLYRGRGCGQCLATGYEGLSAVFEVCPMTDGLRRLVSEWTGPGPFAREIADRVSIREAAVRKALEGDTSVDEALRVS